MLNLDQLQVAVAAAKRHFDLIAANHPDLKDKLTSQTPESGSLFGERDRPARRGRRPAWHCP
jgi:hypothetical protein